MTGCRVSRSSSWVWLIAWLLAGCATALSAEDEANSARVRVTIDHDLARGCELIGVVSADNEKDVQRKAAWIGGNVAVITTESQEARASTAWYRSVTSTTEVYQCEGAR